MKRGMTLIEVMVWVGVFIAAMIAVMTSLLSFYRANTYTLEQAAAVSSAQRGIDRMVKTIREAGYSSQGAYPVVSIGTSTMTFYADVDSDLFVERVHYYLQGTSILQGISDPTGDPPTYPGTEVVSTVSDNVRNATQNVTTFRYYDEAGAEITNFTNIHDVRFILMSIVVNVDTNRLPNELTLRSSATMRNLKSE